MCSVRVYLVAIRRQPRSTRWRGRGGGRRREGGGGGGGRGGGGGGGGDDEGRDTQKIRDKIVIENGSQ